MLHLREKLGNIGVTANVAEIAIQPLLDHDPTKAKICLLDDIGVRAVAAGGLLVV